MNNYLLAYMEFKRWNSDYAFLYMHLYRNRIRLTWGW